jgi:phage-related protein
MVSFASGASVAMAPGTGNIMSAVPPAKSGVGSAVNDTTRQMGGAVGVAVFGSLMASHFHSTIEQKIGGRIPGGLFAQVKDNVGTAVGIAKQSPSAKPYSNTIITAAHDTFVSGLHQVGLVAAAITVLAAVGVAIFLPARARDHEPVPSVEDEPEPIGAVV